ncbi:glycopeptide antibiotics resistance protein [Clostridiales Family XIII bacterium PM5-7]
MAYSITANFVMVYVIILIIIYITIKIVMKRKKFNIKGELKKLIFVMYIIVILSFTILPILIPPIGIKDVIWNFNMWPLLEVFSSRAGLINIAGNIMLFMPIPILGKLNKFKVFDSLINSTIFVGTFSVLIETVQYLESKYGFIDLPGMVVVDINDLITNTLGGIIGWFVVKFYCKNHQ